MMLYKYALVGDNLKLILQHDLEKTKMITIYYVRGS